jgi:hypothetical protein
LSEQVQVLNEADVREFLAPLIEKRHAQMPGGVDQGRLDDDVDGAVGQVLEFALKARGGNGCFMRELGRAVEEVIDELAS